MDRKLERNWNVLWSHPQNCLHIEQMARTIQSGMSAMTDNVGNCYILVATALTWQEAQDFAGEHGSLMDARDVIERASALKHAKQEAGT